MGLFDNFRLSNSTVVQQFPGSKFQELAAVKAQLDDSYLKSQELGLKIQTEAANAPFMEADKAAWRDLNAEAKQTLDSWRTRGDLENALPELYRYAGVVGTKVKSLAEEKKKRDTYLESLNDPKLGLTDEIKKAKILEADRNYSGAKFDEYGRNVNTYTPSQVAKHINNVDRVQQVLRTVTGDSNAVLSEFDALSADPGMVAYKSGSTIQYVSSTKLLNQIRQALELDSEWKASINQETSSKALLENQTLTPEIAEKYLQQSESPEAQLAREYSTRLNLSPQDAILKVSQERHKQALVKTIEDFAKNHASQQTSTTYSEGPTKGQEMEAQENMQKRLISTREGSKGAEADATTILGRSSTSEVSSWAKSGQEVFDKAAKVAESEKALSEKEAAAKKILANPNSSDESKVQANADIKAVQDARSANSVSKQYINYAQNILKQKALDEIQPGTSLKDVEKKNRDYRWREFSKVDVSSTGMSHKDLFLAFERGDVRIESYRGTMGKPTYFINGKAISAAAAEALNSTTPLYKRVEDKAKGLATTGISMNTTAVPIVKEAEVKAVKSLLVGAPAMDISNTEDANLQPGDVDWDKTSSISWIPELNKLRASVTLVDGSVKDLLFDATGMNINKVKGQELAANPDPYVKATGRAAQSGRMGAYVETLNQLNGLIRQHPMKPGEPIMYDGKAVGFQRLQDGSYALVDLADMSVLKSGLSLATMVGFLEVSLGK